MAPKPKSPFTANLRRTARARIEIGKLGKVVVAFDITIDQFRTRRELLVRDENVVAPV